jgi:adenine-specific DNA-methyltransferase
MLMTTDPGDLVFDPSCGSGTTAYVAEKWGRRWITCDTSRVALTLAKQRLMISPFDYYKLAFPEQGVASGFVYKKVPHVTLESIATNPEIKEGLTQQAIKAAIAKYAKPKERYDQPIRDASKTRVTGPFTVEAVPAPVVRPISEGVQVPAASDESVAREGETLRQSEWRDELYRTGVRGKGGQTLRFARVETLAGFVYLHADAEIKDGPMVNQRAVVSFGPEHAPLEQRQVELAWNDARMLSPRPTILLFAAFEFDPEASKDIDEMKPEKVGMTFLKAKMNADLLSEDLKKKRASNESFWLIGQPDIEMRSIKKGDDKGKHQVEVMGFDYFNTRTGKIESGDTKKIAMWMLDTDYDGRSVFPRQVFFPMAGPKEGWARLARNLNAEIDKDRIEAFRGTVSLPFERGKHGRVAVKIVDDRGIESLVIREVR